ncbi:16S rRNA (cytosine(1402)-N(4))-methyltransferase RsmH [Candidatus Parcubacteria bacterium]|nr:MAG: 16S rRNA (cytosine(1402)-N(4))-methyltransferase RsmH [Candidatus Parcubacteria bacterium]
MIFNHKPVLLKKIIENLDVRKEGKYIDATIGGGGYAEAILEKGGRVLGIDADQDAIEFVKNKFQIKNQLILVQDNFANIKKIAEEQGFVNADGIVFDLGLSSYQIEQSGRGFSFLRDEPLDMRMDKRKEIKAADIINQFSREELYDLFTKMGEERFSLPIANNIIRARRIKPIETSLEFARIVEEVIPRSGKIHPATKVFQALRIIVNDELKSLEKGIVDGIDILKQKGRMIVVSFHSLEDRKVKEEFRKYEYKGLGNALNKKPITADENELYENPRARSAKMRVFEKI